MGGTSPLYRHIPAAEAATTTTTTEVMENLWTHENGEGQAHGDGAVDVSSSSSRSTDTRSSQPLITVDTAIERLGMGKFQFIVMIAAGMCFAADAMQVILLTFLSQILRVEWELSNHQTALITSIFFMGAILGTLVLGRLADRRGRKPIFVLTGSIISIFALGVSLCTGYGALLAMIFMVGFGAGGLTVPFDILAECIPSRTRGKNLLLIQYFWTVGVLFVVAVAYASLGHRTNTNHNYNHNNNNVKNNDQQNDSEDGGEQHWREFVCICTLPCIASVIVGIFCVPESPRWLCSVGRSDDALQILRAAALLNGHDCLFPEGTKLVDETTSSAEGTTSDFCELFTPKWRYTTLMLWGTWGSYAFGYYGVILLITEIFGEERLSVDNDATSDVPVHPKYIFDYGAIFVSSSAELVGASLAIFGVERVGRIQVQILSYSIAGLSICALAVVASHSGGVGGGGRYLLISLAFLARIFEMSGSCVTWVSTAEILTTEVRTSGHSAANGVARIGALFAPFLIVGHWSVEQKGLILLAIHCVTVACVSQLPETKGVSLGVATASTTTNLERIGLIEDDENTTGESTVHGESAHDLL